MKSRIGKVDTFSRLPASAGLNRNVYCAHLRYVGSLSRLGYDPKHLRLLKLLVYAGPTRYPHVRPILTNQPTEAEAIGQAMRAGRRLYPGKLVAVMSGMSIRMNAEWRPETAAA